MLKIMTILGTRPEIIRLSRVIEILDKFCTHVVVYTGQNYDPTLYNIFFSELSIRKPDYIFESKAESLMGQVANIFQEVEKVIEKEQPDRVLILGDTNSALSAIVAKRKGIHVFHMEAGNRCYDDRVPEEVNRRLIDHSSDILMPYTERSRANLLREGIESNRIYVIGNPILEVLNHYGEKIKNSDVLKRLDLEKGKYFLVTLHREENVDIHQRLANFLEAFDLLYKKYHYPVICSLHPRTRSQLEKQHKHLVSDGVLASEPFGLFDFVKLEKNAFCVLSDSGTVQEECCIFQVPNVTLRDVTERPETIEAGSNMLSGCESSSILSAVSMVTSMTGDWNVPEEYLEKNVSRKVVKIVLGYLPKQH